MPTPFDRVRLADNPEPRAPCVLVVDTSPAMGPGGLREAEGVIASLVHQWAADPEAARSVELAVVTFGPARVATDFAMVDAFVPPALFGGDDAPLGTAIGLAIDLVEHRKRAVRAEGLLLYRPSILLLTAGRPTGPWHAAAERIRAGIQARAFHCFAIGIEGADVELLSELADAAPLSASGLQLRTLLPWVG